MQPPPKPRISKSSRILTNSRGGGARGLGKPVEVPTVKDLGDKPQVLDAVDEFSQSTREAQLVVPGADTYVNGEKADQELGISESDEEDHDSPTITPSKQVRRDLLFCSNSRSPSTSLVRDIDDPDRIIDRGEGRSQLGEKLNLYYAEIDGDQARDQDEQEHDSRSEEEQESKQVEPEPDDRITKYVF